MYPYQVKALVEPYTVRILYVLFLNVIAPFNYLKCILDAF
jgi:hypothetical protein